MEEYSIDELPEVPPRDHELVYNPITKEIKSRLTDRARRLRLFESWRRERDLREWQKITGEKIDDLFQV